MPRVRHLHSRSVDQAARLLFSSMIVITLTLVGCGGPTADYQSISHEEAVHAEEHGHEHAHTAPHGGHLIELGDHMYSAEVVFGGDTKQLVVYLLDAHAENAVAIPDSEIVFTTEDGTAIALKADPQKGDEEGKSSRFSATGEPLDAFPDLEEIHGSIAVTIEGQEYGGALSHDHDHVDGHDHDHEHEGEKHPD